MTDPKFMQRALQLASLGRGKVSPNPMVGCVIVHEGVIIGEGFHQKYGEPHAEVNAVNSVENKDLLKESTVYVTLEPCSHFGKTPPCADLLIKHRVQKVVISNLDPNPLVAGKGIEKLKNAGIEVETGLLKAEGNDLNRRFFTYHREKRPYVILKWAQTADGFIARKNFDSKWISNEHSRQLVHKWRSEEDSILVGKNTAIHDNPSLTVRDWTGKNPIRILLDAKLEVSRESNLFDETAQTLVFNSIRSEKAETSELIRLSSLDPNSLLKELFDRKILSVLVEGGTSVLTSFISSGLWDEARVFTSPELFGDGILAPKIYGKVLHKEQILTDTLIIYENSNG